MSGLYSWRNFWIFWIGGLAILGYLIVNGSELFTEAAPQGMIDHQSGGTAERINEIQNSWAAAGKLTFVKYAMIADLIFIGLYSLGGIIGGRLIWQQAGSPSLKKLGLLVIFAHFSFGLLDYCETISQFIQLMSEQGSDFLAAFAAFCQPPKFVAFFVSFAVMIVALIWRAIERRSE